MKKLSSAMIAMMLLLNVVGLTSYAKEESLVSQEKINVLDPEIQVDATQLLKILDPETQTTNNDEVGIEELQQQQNMQKILESLKQSLLKLNDDKFDAEKEQKKLVSFLQTLAQIESDDICLSRVTDKDLPNLAKAYKEIFAPEDDDDNVSEEDIVDVLQSLNEGNNVSFIIKDTDGNQVGEILLCCVDFNLVRVAFWVSPQFIDLDYAAKACELIVKTIYSDFSTDVFFFMAYEEDNDRVHSAMGKLNELLTSECTA